MPELILNSKTTITESSGNFIYNNGYIFPSGKYLNVSHFYYSTRTSLTDRSSDIFWSFDVNKLYDADVSDLRLFCLLPGHDNYSNQCGVFIHIDGSTSRETDGTAFYDVGYTGADADSESFAISSIAKDFPNLPSGTHMVKFGWQTRDLGTGNKPFVIWNNNSSDDARQHQTRSQCTIFEVKK